MICLDNSYNRLLALEEVDSGDYSKFLDDTERIVRSLDRLMEEDMLTYIAFVMHCHDPYNKETKLSEKVSDKLVERRLMQPGYVIPSEIRTAVLNTTKIY